MKDTKKKTNMISLKLDDDEKALLVKYAEFKSLPLSVLIRATMVTLAKKELGYV